KRISRAFAVGYIDIGAGRFKLAKKIKPTGVDPPALKDFSRPRFSTSAGNGVAGRFANSKRDDRGTSRMTGRCKQTGRIHNTDMGTRIRNKDMHTLGIRLRCQSRRPRQSSASPRMRIRPPPARLKEAFSCFSHLLPTYQLNLK